MSFQNTSHSLTSAISFQESFQLQKKALERERIALAKKQLQLNAENHGAGEKLKKALGAQPDIASFM